MQIPQHNHQGGDAAADQEHIGLNEQVRGHKDWKIFLQKINNILTNLVQYLNNILTKNVQYFNNISLDEQGRNHKDWIFL